MTDQEKKDTLDNMLVCYVDRTYLTNKQIGESEIFIEELKAAISVTRCCESDSEQLEADFISIVGKEAHFYKDGKIFKKEKLKFSD